LKDLFSAVTEGIIPKDPLYNTPGYTLNEKIAVALALESPKGNLFYEDRFDNLYGPGRSEEIKTLRKKILTEIKNMTKELGYVMEKKEYQISRYLKS